jgi:hypothetical protein
MAEPRHLPRAPLRLVPREPEPRVGLRISVEMATAPLGRSRIFRLRPCDVAELLRQAEVMEARA